MKPRCHNRFLSALIISTGFALSLPTAFAATATKAGTGTDLNDAASWSGGSGPGFPTSADIATWASTSLGAGLTLGSNGSWGGISVASALSDIDISGAGTLTLAGSGINLSASTVNMSVANPVTLSAAQTWNVISGKTLTLSGNVGGGQNLTISGGGTNVLSGTNSFGALALGNTTSATVTPVLSFTSGTTSFSARPCIGSNTAARGVLSVSGTATVNFGGDLLMFAGNGASNLRASAVLKQSGGTINVTPGTLMPWAGTGGVAYGACLLSGGTLNATGEWRVNNQGSDLGLFSQSGGTATFTNGLVLNNNDGCNFPAIADISGGTLTHESTGNMMATIANLGVLTVRGTGYLTDKSTNFSVASNGTGILNLLTGGTIEANQIKKVGGTATMNCDGGTLKPFSTNAGSTFLTGLNKMFLYPGGLTFDSAGQSVTIAQALVAPTGYGVGASGTTIPVFGGSGYIAPPLVTFAAPTSGVAATGVAEIDSNGVVTQIRITSPGSGYTSGQSVAVTFNGGDNTANEAATVAPGFNTTASTLNASGGLTKIGSGTLTLNATETYTGTTAVNAGTLALGASGVLANASNVTLAAGATLDVSALATYTLGSSATLTASGTGTTAGTNAAAIKGGATGTVSLGSRPVTLNWSGAASGTDSTHPALTVSQGTLSLSNNQFTVVSGSALGVGVYTLVNAPAITGTVNATPLYTGGSGVGAGLVGAVSISGSNVILTVSASSPVVSASGTLTAVSAIYGTPSGETSFTISGSDLAAGIVVQPPAGYEVSATSGSGFSGNGVSISVGGPPTVSSATIYVRLAANAPVGGTFDAQNITVSSTGATPVTIATATGNSVSAKALTVASAAANNKLYDGGTSGTVTGTLQPAEAFGTGNSGDGKPYTGDVLTVTAPGTFASSAVGTGIPVTPGTFTLGGAAAGNYTLTQPTGLSLSANILSTAVWTNTAGGSWITTGNWQNNLMATGSDITADFGTLSLPANAIVTLDGARTIGNLIFNDQNTTKHSWTLNPNVAGNLTLAVNSGSPTITTSVATTLNTVIAGTQGLTKAGSGTLTLGGANSYTGATAVNAGTLNVGTSSVSGTLPATSAITLGANGSSGATLNHYYGGNVTLASLTVASGSSGTSFFGGSTVANQSVTVNSLTLNAPLTTGLATGTGQNTIIQFNSISGGAAAGTDALIFSNQANANGVIQGNSNNGGLSYTGNAHFKTGSSGSSNTFLLQNFTGGVNAGIFSSTTDVVIDSGVTLKMNNSGGYTSTFTFNALSGSGTWNNGSASGQAITLSMGNGDGTGSFSGLISNTTSTTSVIKNGSGTQTLTGANTYSGTTTVNNGKLLVTNTTGSGTGSGAITVNANGTFGGTGSVSGALTVNASGNIAPGTTGTGTLTTGAATISGTYACQIDGANSDKIASTGSLTLTNATLAISTINAPTATSYVIATFTGATPSFTTVTGLPAGYAVDTTSTAGQIKLVKGGYASWAATNAPSGTPTDDYDGDGVSNALEWVLGGLASTHDQGKLPTVSTNGGNLVFTFVRNDEAWQSGDTTTQIQVGTTLASWPNVYNVGIDTASSSPEVTITDNGTTDTVKLTIPMGTDAKKFARLKTTVTVAP